MTRRPWTDDEIATLESLAEAGTRDKDIAVQLGRSLHSVRCKRVNLGLESTVGQGRPRKHDYQAIGAELDRGGTIAEVSRRLGIVHEAVRRVARL